MYDAFKSCRILVNYMNLLRRCLNESIVGVRRCFSFQKHVRPATCFGQTWERLRSETCRARSGPNCRALSCASSPRAAYSCISKYWPCFAVYVFFFTFWAVARVTQLLLPKGSNSPLRSLPLSPGEANLL